MSDNSINNISKHHTPEGLVLELVPAGIMPRVSAWLLDFVIRVVVMFILAFVLAWFGGAGYGVLLIVYFFINWLYPVVFEVWFDGMTPGKKVNGIYVCHDDGTPISLQSSMIRNLLRVADFMPMFFMSGLISIMFNKKSQRIGDMAAGTLVVYKLDYNMDKVYRTVSGVKRRNLVDNVVTNQANPSMASDSAQSTRLYDVHSPLFTYGLSYTEQKALLSLQERLDFLTTERQQEITYHLAALVQPNTTHMVNKEINNKKMVFDAVSHKMLTLKGNSSTTR